MQCRFSGACSGQSHTECGLLRNEKSKKGASQRLVRIGAFMHTPERDQKEGQIDTRGR